MRNLSVLTLLFVPLFAAAQPPDAVRVYGMGGKSITSWHGQAAVTAVSFELTRALSPRLDVGFVLSPMNVNQPRSWFGNQYGDGDENVRALAGAVLFRRYFWSSNERARLFVEGATGPMWSERKVPASTSRFNFNSQAAAGFVLMPHSAMPVIVGYRFMHISNGGYAPRNPGLGVSSLMIGTTIRLRR